MTTIYGIKNCDTMKKAMKWLDDHGIVYQFHDFKKAGLSETQIKEWVAQVGWERLVNSRGTSWRNLPESERENINEATAISLMLANLSLIKRPVVEQNNTLHIGFNVAEYQALFK